MANLLKRQLSHSFRSLHGIFPIWKPPDKSTPELQKLLRESILESSGVQFKHVPDFEVELSPKRNLNSEGSSGMILCGIGRGCKAFPGVHRDAMKVYHVNFAFSDAARQIEEEKSRLENEEESQHSKPNDFTRSKLKKQRKNMHQVIPRPNSFDFRQVVKELPWEEMTENPCFLHSYSWPQFVLQLRLTNDEHLNELIDFSSGKLQEGLPESGRIHMESVCRMQISPFYKYDALPEQLRSLEEIGRAMRRVKVMHGKKFADFLSKDEWIEIGRLL